MKAAIALLANYPTQNFARRMVYEMRQYAEIEYFGSLLPSHVSLKQPFSFEVMPPLEHWFDTLAMRIQPFEIKLDSVYYSEWEGSAIVGLNVVETPTLRNLHNLINQELEEIVENPTAPHDGEGYHFHLTVELGRIGATNPYKAFYEKLPNKNIALSFLSQNLAMFIYNEHATSPGSYMLYRVMSLGNPQTSQN